MATQARNGIYTVGSPNDTNCAYVLVQAVVEVIITGHEQAAQIAVVETNGIPTVGAPAADCADVLGQQKQAMEAKKSLAVKTAPMQPEVETERHDNHMYKMPMELRDDHHVNFHTKKKRVILDDEVVDSLSDLDEVMRIPYPWHRLSENLKSFLHSINAKTQEPLEVITASPELSGIQKPRDKKKTYSVTRTILTRHATRAFKGPSGLFVHD
ncbi:hypothetical protein ACH5RR_008774 [Cinchona calisaya]|uniref:Uncharacterized protein n=1 Tax=Cinchona calisaya TaxID=153742 RepID=A0ABD3ACK2_9GENT